MTRRPLHTLALIALSAWWFAVASVDAEAAEQERPAKDQRSCVERVALQVQARYESVRDFRARFEQSTERVGFAGDSPDALRAAGEVFFQKPGRMHWAYTEPARSFVISNGVGAWIYDPVAAEAQYFELGSEFLSGAALQFLLGEGKLLDEFSVHAEACDGAATVTLEMVPKEPTSFERLDLLVDPRNGEVSETRVVDLLGNRTRLLLRDSRFGQAPAEDHFEFTPPSGTRVLTMPAGPAQ